MINIWAKKCFKVSVWVFIVKCRVQEGLVVKKWQILSRLFLLLALVLSHLMCVVVAYNYGMLKYAYWSSAPPDTAFILLIPYGIGILAMAWFCYSKMK